jgi:uncharacterized protein (TIGR03905 family)
MITYKTKGVCAKEISFEVKEGIITAMKFDGGCPGNLLGIQLMVIDKTPEEVIEKLKGIKCGGKDTSCPDQLTLALENYILSSVESA